MALNWPCQFQWIKVAVRRDRRMAMPVPVDQLEIRRTVMPADRQVTSEAAVCQFRFRYEFHEMRLSNGHFAQYSLHNELISWL